MDAYLWHQQARAEAVEAPSVHTVAEIRAMSTSARESYVGARRRWLRSLRFDTAAARWARRTLTDLVEDNRHSPPGAKDVIAVSASFAVGKSTLVRAWAQEIYRQTIGDRIRYDELPTWRKAPGVVADEIPVVWFDLGAASKVRAFNMQLLQYFGYPLGGAIHDLTARIPQAIDAHRVRLVIVDDTNLLNLRHKDARDVLDHLKHVNTVLGQRGASMVLVGADLEHSPIYSDPQIAGRLRTVNLHPQTIDTPQDAASWQNVLEGIETTVLPYLPAARPGLLAGQHAPRIWRRTQGYLGDVARLVTEAAHLAAIEDAWTIRVAHLEQVQLSRRAMVSMPPDRSATATSTTTRPTRPAKKSSAAPVGAAR